MPARNTLILLTTQAFFNAALALEVMWLSRWLPAVDMGYYFYALSLGSLLEVLVHWGSQHYINREAAGRYLWARRRLPLLWVTGLGALVLLACGLAVAMGPGAGLVAASVMARAAGFWLGGAFIGRGDLAPPVVARVVSQVLLLAAMWWWVRPQPGLERVGWVLAGVSGLHVVGQLFCLRRIGFALTGGHLSPWKAAWPGLMRRLWPFAALFFLAQLQYRADAVLIEWLVGIKAVNQIMLAFKWVEGIFFVAAIVATAALPHLVAKRAAATAHWLLGGYSLALGGGLTLVAAAMWLAAEPLLYLVIGERAPIALPHFTRLVWALPLQGLAFFWATALVAWDGERRVLGLSLVGAIAGLGLKAAALLAAGPQGFVGALLMALGLSAALFGTALWRDLRRGMA